MGEYKHFRQAWAVNSVGAPVLEDRQGRGMEEELGS